jgi:nitrate/nitrite-specific signal transduction histidine kinase
MKHDVNEYRMPAISYIRFTRLRKGTCTFVTQMVKRQNAIRNAFAHSGASHIEVEIHYDEGELRLRIRDDGKGIDRKILESGQSGHWGIPGMRERAQKIGSRLDFWGEKGAGTEVQLTVPAPMAYQKHRNGRRFGLFHRE